MAHRIKQTYFVDFDLVCLISSKAFKIAKKATIETKETAITNGLNFDIPATKLLSIRATIIRPQTLIKKILIDMHILQGSFFSLLSINYTFLLSYTDFVCKYKS